MKGLIFDIKRYSIHDGPGLRTTVFFKGCPLRCPWCHNPESQKTTQEIMYYEDKCILCLTCVNVCNQEAIDIKYNKIVINEKKCTLCGDCTDSCPTTALKMVGKFFEVKELATEIMKDQNFIENGGGVTISGGEPILQWDFLMELLSTLKSENVHIALDTSGFTETYKLLSTAKLVDLYLYDIKLMDPEKHKAYTGVGNKEILKNIMELDKIGAKISVRIPVIPTINDNTENIEKTVEFVSKLKNIASVDLLPYHSMMVDKYKRLKKPFFLGSIKKPSNETLENIKGKFERKGFKVNIGG